MNGREIAQRWLNELSFTVATRNLKEHMALVSRQVAVLGIPGKDIIDYDGWLRRRRNEFQKGLLQSIKYEQPMAVDHHGDRLSFNVVETMRGTAGEVLVLDKDITLVQEHGRWRVRRERINRIQIKR